MRMFKRTTVFAACAMIAVVGLAVGVPHAAAEPPQAADAGAALTGVLHLVHGHYKLNKNGSVHLLDVTAVPLAANRLLGREVHITGHIVVRTVNNSQTRVFVVQTMTVAP